MAVECRWNIRGEVNRERNAGRRGRFAPPRCGFVQELARGEHLEFTREWAAGQAFQFAVLRSRVENSLQRLGGTANGGEIPRLVGRERGEQREIRQSDHGVEWIAQLMVQ